MSWIFYTIAAVIFQTFRNLEQKSLNKKLDALTVSWSRFILPLPFAIAAAIYSFSSVSNQFILYCFITAMAQVAGNVCLLQTFKKNFSIGIAFYKTEVLQALVIGLIFFNDHVSVLEIIAIITTTIGAILMSGLMLNDDKKLAQSINGKSAIYGLLCGLFFSISAFSLKIASQNISTIGYSQIGAPMMVLMWVLCFQNLLFVVIKFFQNRLRQDLKSLFSAENKYAFLRTTILSFLGSAGWFIAYAIGKVVYVKAVGQIELVLAIIISHFVLKERLKPVEFSGVMLTACGILWLIFLH